MNYSKYIDHTLLKPDCTDAQIKLLCEEAKTYNFASVCVNPGYIKMCSELLKDSGVDVCTVVGFPLGAMASAAKDPTPPMPNTATLAFLSLSSFSFPRSNSALENTCSPSIIYPSRFSDSLSSLGRFCQGRRS
jgi:hypothetical protein